MKYHPTRPPSRGERWVICDVCGFKYHLKDVTRITDKWNRQYGLVVCKNDILKTNPHGIPRPIREAIVTSPEMIRPQPPLDFVTNDNDDRVPSAPRNGEARANPIDDYIDLFWEGPLDTGSSGIIHYVIQRADPQLAGYSTVGTTDGGESYFTDTTATITTEYSYRVAAVNSFGQGAWSEDFYWPTDTNVLHDIDYLVTGDSQALDMGSGVYLRLNYQEQGII